MVLGFRVVGLNGARVGVGIGFRVRVCRSRVDL